MRRDVTTSDVYRVVDLCLAIVGDSRVELEKIAVAAVFHDLGIWTNKTFDYIAPSVAIAREHLTTPRGRTQAFIDGSWN